MRLRNATTGAVVNVSDSTAARLGPIWEPADTTSAGSTAGYDGMTVDELKDEIRTRNEERDEDDRLPLTGTKSDLIAVLEADDE